MRRRPLTRTRGALPAFLLLAALATHGESLSLDELTALAMDGSLTLRLKAMEVRRSSYALQERKAARLPALELQGSASYLTNPPEGIAIRKGELGSQPAPNSEAPVAFPAQDFILLEDTEHTYFKITATLAQPVFTWGKLAGAVTVAELQRQGAVNDFALARRELRHEIRMTYFSALLAKESAFLLEQSTAILRDIVADRRRSFDEGLINRQTVLEAQSRLAAAEASAVDARESYSSAVQGLAVLSGVDMSGVELSEGRDLRLPAITEEELREAALASSPELEELRLKAQQARAAADIERSSGLLRPDFSLNVTLDITGQRVPVLGANWTDSWDADLVFTLGTRVKLLDFGTSHARARGAEEQATMAASGLEQMRQAVELNVRRAYRDVQKAYYDALEQKARFQEVAEQLKNARVSYENELLTREDLRFAEVQELGTRIEAALALYTLETAIAQMEYLAGRPVD